MILAEVQQTGFQNFRISFIVRLNVKVEYGLVKIYKTFKEFAWTLLTAL